MNPGYSVDTYVYQSLDKLFRSPSLSAVSITVIDNTFNAQKAQILYQMLSSNPGIKAFTFRNNAGDYNFNDS